MHVSFRLKSPMAAFAIAALLAWPRPAPARELSGTLSLGKGLSIVIALSEGFFSEILRTVHLRTAPRPVVDLTELGKTGDRLFVGTDFNLYCEKWSESGYSPDRTFKVGNATRLWEILTNPGVKLKEVQSAIGNIVGDTHKHLLVDGKLVDSKPADVSRPDFKFWLDEIVFQYDNPGRRKGKIDNCTVISASVLDALPDHSDDPQERFDNLNVLVGYVRAAKDIDLIPLRDLLKRKIGGVKEQAASGPEAQALLKGYEDLQGEVMRRTDGL